MNIYEYFYEAMFYCPICQSTLMTDPTNNNVIHLIYNNKVDTALEKKIDRQEVKDRFIATAIYNKIIDKETITHIHQPNSYSFDLLTKAENKGGKQYNFYTEIKECNLNKAGIECFGTVLLKKEKLQRMTAKGKDNTAVYMVLMNNEKKAYIFNLNKINWSEIQQTTLSEKITQLDNNSPKKDFEMYLLPLNKAYKVVDYTDEYNNYKQICDANHL